MDLTSSCVLTLRRIFHSHNIYITIDGKVIYKYIYIVNALKVCSLIMIGMIAYIIKQYRYVPVTIIDTSMYSQLSAVILHQSKIPFIVSKYPRRRLYYEVEDKEIAFETPNIVCNDSITTLIPHSTEEISKLEKHTGFTNLSEIQDTILQDSIKVNNLLESSSYADPIVQIRNVCGKFYYIMTGNDIWITKVIISDKVSPLHCGDIVSTLCGTINSKSNDNCNIRYVDDSCIVNELDKEIILKRRDGYKVKNNLSIVSIDKSLNDLESAIYNLKVPRPFNHNSVYTMHPFHLPATWDPLLSIMIVSKALALSLK